MVLFIKTRLLSFGLKTSGRAPQTASCLCFRDRTEDWTLASAVRCSSAMGVSSPRGRSFFGKEMTGTNSPPPGFGLGLTLSAASPCLGPAARYLHHLHSRFPPQAPREPSLPSQGPPGTSRKQPPFGGQSCFPRRMPPADGPAAGTVHGLRSSYSTSRIRASCVFRLGPPSF